MQRRFRVRFHLHHSYRRSCLFADPLSASFALLLPTRTVVAHTSTEVTSREQESPTLPINADMDQGIVRTRAGHFEAVPPFMLRSYTLPLSLTLNASSEKWSVMCFMSSFCWAQEWLHVAALPRSGALQSNRALTKQTIS